MTRQTTKFALLVLALFAAGCSSELPKHMQPLSYTMQAELKLRDLAIDAPIMMRIFKQDSELEIWKRGFNGKYTLLKTYPICKWSGALGPKKKEGDRQAPEGFYTIKVGQMNPWSKYYLSFNLGYPNTFDRTYGRTGAHLMVHGDCSSAGCYSMTDEIMADIYALAREAFEGGQDAFQVQAFPFRLTEENLQKHKEHGDYEFWLNLKEGYDAFEQTQIPPKVNVCGKRYVFNANFSVADNKIDPAAPCPPQVAPEATLASAGDAAAPAVAPIPAPVTLPQLSAPPAPETTPLPTARPAY